MKPTTQLRLAALANIAGIAIFTRGFTNSYLSSLFPELFGPLGWIFILLWGMAYASVARGYSAVPGVLAVFALEKLVYVLSWLYWLAVAGARLPQIWARDPLTAIFYSGYGALDLAFGIVFLSLYRASRTTRF